MEDVPTHWKGFAVSFDRVVAPAQNPIGGPVFGNLDDQHSGWVRATVRLCEERVHGEVSDAQKRVSERSSFDQCRDDPTGEGCRDGKSNILSATCADNADDGTVTVE